MYQPDPKVKYQPRKQAGRDPKYCAWLRTQQCAACWFPPPSIVAHQRIIGSAGIGIKPPDSDAVPLCRHCHALEHAGAVTFWNQGTREKTREFVEMVRDWHISKYEKEKS